MIDGDDAAGDLPADLMLAVAVRIQVAVMSIQSLIAAFAGVVPFSVLTAPEGMVEERQPTFTMAAEGESSPLDDPNVVAASVDSSSLERSTDAVNVTVDTSAPDDAGQSEDSGPTETPESQDDSEDGPGGDDVTP